MVQWLSQTVPIVVVACVTVVLQGCGPSLENLSAGRVGASPDDITISNEQHDFGSTTWVATHDGVRYQCARNTLPTSGIAVGSRGGSATWWGNTTDISCTPMKTQPQPHYPAVVDAGYPPDGREPKGGVGFSFGADAKEAERTCSGAGFSWKNRDAGSVFTCSGSPAGFGVPSEVRIKLCGGKICEIAVDLNVDAAEWTKLVARYKKLLAGLEDKYGGPYHHMSDPLDDCTDELSACFAKGRVRISTLWKWQTGQKMSAVLDGGSAHHPSLQVVYGTDTPDAGRPTAPEPATSVAPAPPTAGCTKDTDCKGDRVCEKGVCSAPTSSPGGRK